MINSTPKLNLHKPSTNPDIWPSSWISIRTGFQYSPIYYI